MEQLYSLQSAADKLDISVRTLRRLIKKHQIDVKRVGARIRLSESDLEALVDDDSVEFIAETLL